MKIPQEKVSDFHTDYQFSVESSMMEFWDQAYKLAFPNYEYSEVCSDTFWQLKGVDRVVYLSNGHSLHVDEKSRRKPYPDIALEYLSNDSTGSPGWIEKDLNIDYLAYAFVTIKVIYFFPWPFLRRAWIKHGEAWKDTYFNPKAPNPGYFTHSVAVPIDVLYEAVASASVVRLT